MHGGAKSEKEGGAERDRDVCRRAQRGGRNWIGEQMRSTIAKPDVLRLLIPDMADSIIHRFANSSNIRAGAAIAASQPLRRGSRPRRVRTYYWFRAWVYHRLRTYPRSYVNGLGTLARGCAHLQMRARVKSSGATESNETAFNLPIDDDFVHMPFLAYAFSPARVLPLVLLFHSSILETTTNCLV